MSAAQSLGELSPYLAIEREDWAELGKNTQLPLTEQELTNLKSLGDFLDMKEVEEVYLPVSHLLSLYANQTQKLHSAASNFLGEKTAKTPFIIGIAGSVAVGKSTVARLLKELMSRWDGTPKVELVTTDGFLYPNAELESRGILDRKGFPESYDRKRLLKFVSDIKSGVEQVTAPVYSHLSYDIVEGEFEEVRTPDVLILEGLNVLQPPAIGQELALSDFFDFTIYIDANPNTIEDWYLSRFLQLWTSAFTNPRSYFHPLTKQLNQEQAIERAEGFWKNINLPNLRENILPTRGRANLVLRKGENHRVESVLLRKL